MIELRYNELHFTFPDVHPSARVEINFQRTLRIPDDGNDHPLPPGLGAFPLRHVDDFVESVPPSWIEHGGVMLPMHSAEAMWLNFNGHEDPQRKVDYPFAVRIAAGKINAVTGQIWTRGLHENPQDYVVIPEQPWLDGFAVEKGTIRQFVATQMGHGYTAEEQITGEAEHGGVQIEVFPMKREVFERRFPIPKPIVQSGFRDICFSDVDDYDIPCRRSAAPMGLGAGGRMRQKIESDPFHFSDWDRTRSLRCFVHLTHARTWHEITGEAPPTDPPTAAQYSKAGLPWFDYDSGGEGVDGSPILAGLESLSVLGKKKGESPLPENESVAARKVVQLRLGLQSNQVREGQF